MSSDTPERLQGEAFTPPSLPIRLAMSLGPLAGFSIVVIILYYLRGSGTASFLVATGLASFIGAGKLVIFAGAVDGAPANVWTLALLVVYSDVGTGLFMMANMFYLYKLPFLGPKMVATREAGYRVLNRHLWMRHFTWLGVAVFIAVPFQVSGSVLGTVIGRLLGLSRTSLLASIFTGSAVGSCALALLGSFGQSHLTRLFDSPMTSAAFAVIFFIIIFLLGRWFMGNAEESRS